MDLDVLERTRQSQEQGCHMLMLCSPSALAKRWPKYFFLDEAISRKCILFSDEQLYEAHL